LRSLQSLSQKAFLRVLSLTGLCPIIRSIRLPALAGSSAVNAYVMWLCMGMILMRKNSFHTTMKLSRAKVGDIEYNIYNIPVIILILITYELLGSHSHFIAYSNYKIDPLGTHAYTVAGRHSTSPGCTTTHDLRATHVNLVICALHLDSQYKNILAKPECDCNMIAWPRSPALPPPIDARFLGFINSWELERVNKLIAELPKAGVKLI